MDNNCNGYDQNLKRIPSEFIEPYLQDFLMLELQSIAYGFDSDEQIDESKNNLKGVESFVGPYCGIHSQYATMNEYRKFYDLPNDDLRKLAKKVFKIKLPKKTIKT